MATTVLITRPYGLVLTETSGPCIVTQWRAFASASEFIALQEAALRYFETHSTPEQPWGWVGDVHRLQAIPVQAQDWLLTDFIPRAAAVGLRELSLVQSPTSLSPPATQRYAHGTTPSGLPYALRTAYFPSLEAALVGARLALAQPVLVPHYH
ncbi:hypothetical protein E4631_06600 [Hymenobacter sp. UV11]|uniref:hypothetical protein n=1 Tax=Hymenobacter sp. UV11 TaxID=1849735 RepID=UPI00105C32A9|nr:hypothetical protein [Hymenobacter sp. UV11]TDN38184.1 hypothetical protein A8B98_24540 [Hymenobacter sp. UV11]TFZ67643.1 hypothetical protein E4631_06600 [Hymenobacter sp. UV11]